MEAVATTSVLDRLRFESAEPGDWELFEDGEPDDGDGGEAEEGSFGEAIVCND